MKGIGRYRRLAIFADNMHLGDSPNLACRYDEIVRSEAVIIIEYRLEILRCDATWRRGRVIELIVEDDTW